MIVHRRQPTDTVADVALLLEGTYPFVRGGVSSWIDEILRGLPQRTFSLVFIGSSRDAYGPPAYELPPNVVHFECHFLQDKRRGRPGASGLAVNPKAFKRFEALHEMFDGNQTPPLPLLEDASITFGTAAGITRDDFLRSKTAWDGLCNAYRERSLEPSFLDYFWTVRTIYQPLFTLSEVAPSLPPARAFHAISTGYAGLLGMQLALAKQRPFILTEHGIYTKERRIDLANARWLKDSESSLFGSDDDASYLRMMWIRFFEASGRAAYAVARPIVSLYEGNRQRQIQDGADPPSTRVIPNGIDVERFSPLREQRADATPLVVGLLGRVVPIKDVRHFIRAMRVVCNRLPVAEGWIVGPTEEDPAYFENCQGLIRSLGLEGRVRFLGFRRPEDILPKLGVLTLTSISEALPLAVLEAYAAGLPVVTTDVGSCRELVEGGSAEDRALGSAGIVVPIAQPQATADALVTLLTDKQQWRAAQASGIARVQRFYTRRQMLDSYASIYEEACSWPA